MKKIIVFFAALVLASQAMAIQVTVDNNTGTCTIDVTVTPVDGSCTPTAAPATSAGMLPTHSFDVVDGTGAVDFQIDITVIDNGGNKIVSTFYADGSAICTGGVVSGSTSVMTNCSGAFVTATVSGPPGAWTVSVN